MKKVCVLGDGAWGTAIALLLSDNGYDVNLWCHFKEVADQIKECRENKKNFPGFFLPENILPTTDLQKALDGVDIIFEAIPVEYLREVLEQAKPFIFSNHKFVLLSKGIETKSLMFPYQIVQNIFGEKIEFAVVSGPSFAKDLAAKQITAMTVAGSCDFAKQIQKILANNYCRPYTSQDILGVSFGGAVKNVFALGVGILDGADFGDNTKIFILTRGFASAVELAQKMGANKDTLYGLSGVGDLILTCMGKYSKNLNLGREIGQGKHLNNFDLEVLPEGINTLKSIDKLAKQFKVEMAEADAIYKIIFEKANVAKTIQKLVDLPLSNEC
ncbi:MAG: Glycerol-3-phosphate dehydrogenase [NAD(P)+] [candidate division TM6 bacterium GW2011_GWF2_32_72]|nr:MAG: Glycerol-3-phosphate dehydrogenase [NAD(P)+] [candidate division TM6 bacterium GW2011_GWF2_32_72]